MCKNEGEAIYGLAQKGHPVGKLTHMRIGCTGFFKVTGAIGYPGSYILLTKEILETVQSVQALSDQRKHRLEASPKLRTQEARRIESRFSLCSFRSFLGAQ